MKASEKGKANQKCKQNTHIEIVGARVHNLKNINVSIPINKMTVITGLSGSGKSTLAFDTLFAEGQRRYVESLSSYARQFLGRMMKPDVDAINGISPAIAIEQNTGSRNPRSTVGTVTEVYDYLKLLYARIGRTFSPVSGREVKRHQVSDVVDFVLSKSQGAKVFVLSPFVINEGRDVVSQVRIWSQQGFSRIWFDNQLMNIDSFLDQQADSVDIATASTKLFILVDRLIISQEDDELSLRLADSIQTAFNESDSSVTIVISETEGSFEYTRFSGRFEMDGIRFEEPSVNLFSFNNPFGACKKCEGFGSIIGLDPNLVIPDKSISVYDGAIVCWKGEKMGEWLNALIKSAHKFDFPVHKPVKDLSPEQNKLLWMGNKYFEGLNNFFIMLEENSYKIQYRVMLSRYKGKTICPSCHGTRLREDASFVKVGGYSLTELLLKPISDLRLVFPSIDLTDFERKVAKNLLIEINNRLDFMFDTGLGYLTLSRLSNSLSGGETQRINLAKSLGSSLIGSMYILDEPSVGLHPRDTSRLIGVLQKLRDIGNTVIIVEHDEDIIKASDYIVDLGPLAGRNGGSLMYQGSVDKLVDVTNSQTAKYFNGELNLDIPKSHRPVKNEIRLLGVRENNIDGIDVTIPLQMIVAVTGVSGSGKSTLIRQVFYPSLKKLLGGQAEFGGKLDSIEGDYNLLTAVELVDQNPIGRSSRSNPATYLKAFDEIRDLYSQHPLSKMRAYKPGYFSFNVEGGRCETCQGEGMITVEMQFMADVKLICEECNGKRYKEEVLDVQYNGKSISQVLEMTIDEAVIFFQEGIKKKDSLESKIIDKLKPLQEVGLGYLQMGQPSSTLSGGEAQRIKLAYFLSKGDSQGATMFIFDEPTTGLHYYDILGFYNAIVRLVKAGHSIIIIEHNMELVKCSDWIIDLGPEGGNEGGQILFEGVPEDLFKIKSSHTANALIEKFKNYGGDNKKR